MKNDYVLPVLLCAVLGAGAASNTYGSPFDSGVQRDRPILYLPMDHDPSHVYAQMPNGDHAKVFNGTSDFVEVSSPALSIPNKGVLTIEAWLRPTTLQFRKQEADGYVYWMGKGEPGAYEYAGRMYSLTNAANRPSRISGYAFNLDGGLGSGSYVQDPVRVGEWIYVTVVFNTKHVSHTYPAGYVRIYKNGVLRDTTGLDQFHVIPEAGDAPLRIGTRNFTSFFQGAIGKFAVYDYELTSAQIQAHQTLMHPDLSLSRANTNGVD